MSFARKSDVFFELCAVYAPANANLRSASTAVSMYRFVVLGKDIWRL